MELWGPHGAQLVGVGGFVLRSKGGSTLEGCDDSPTRAQGAKQKEQQKTHTGMGYEAFKGHESTLIWVHYTWLHAGPRLRATHDRSSSIMYLYILTHNPKQSPVGF